MKTRLYDRIKQLLESNPELRNSDKRLMWRIWTDEGLTRSNVSLENEGTYFYDRSIFFNDFLVATSPESIRRARQLVVHAHPELGPTSEKIKRVRRTKELTKGTFGYRETINYNLSPNGQESFV